MQLINGDCLVEMAQITDGSVDMVLTDPPYGKQPVRTKCFGTSGSQFKFNDADWDKSIPPKSVFDEIFRISTHQIIFGGNYFTEFLPPSNCWLFWDKKGDMNTSEETLLRQRPLFAKPWKWNPVAWRPSTFLRAFIWKSGLI